jgi:two-component system heavy metal sensor histidine kinase CusS
MVMSGVLYEHDGKVHEATMPFERTPPPYDEVNHDDGVPFDFRFRNQHFRGVFEKPSGTTTMRILIAESREELDSDERFLVRAMITAAILAVLWAVAVASWRASELTREQRAIADTVRRFAQGKLEARVSVQSSDPETAQLASDINDMTARIGTLMSTQKRFVAHAAHELRSPLTKLYGELQLALRKDRTAPEYKRAIEEALDATRKLKTLADDLLTLARAQGAEENAGPEHVEVERLVSDALALIANADASRVEKSGATCVVHGQAADLVRLIRNLIENAFAHSPAEGRVRIDWIKNAGDVEIRIADDGDGVPESLRERIFEPFFRASRTHGGSGLGLGIAREIARAHAGDVVVGESARGAVFVVTLPLENN